MIGVLSVIGGTAVVRDLEGDGGVSVAIGVSGWSEDEIADISDSNKTSALFTAFPSRVSEPAEAVVVMVTDWKESLSGSEKPKSEASKV